MKLFEYQAKKIFAENGLSVPDGILVASEEELHRAAEKLGFPCVLKAQVLSGGRGKRGLVKVVRDPEEADAMFAHIRRETGETTGVLVEEAVDIAQEVYVAILPDSRTGEVLLMTSAEGGVEIEALSASNPEKILSVRIDPDRGLQPYQLRQLTFDLKLGEYGEQYTRAVSALYRVFTSTDAEMAEINPLFLTKSGKVIAGDGKLLIDDNSLFRHPEIPRTSEITSSTPAEFMAAQEGIPFLQFDGDIGLLCAGAGITNMTLDLIKAEGGTASNYLEFGGPHYRKAELAMRLCMMTDPKVVLVVTFGTIARGDVVAQGVLDAREKLGLNVPLITCIRGTNEEEAAKILEGADVYAFSDVEEAVAKAVELAAERRKK